MSRERNSDWPASARLRAWIAVLSVASAGAAGTPALAQDATPLRGEVFIAGRYVVAPLAGDPKNTHAYVTVQGPAAVRMYKNMKAREQQDLCVEGHKLKRAGKLYCSLAPNGQDATCDFSVNLLNGTLADGKPC